jgi:hypothetical protein
MTRLKLTTCALALLALVWLSAPLHAWGPQGHRLVALIAATYLTGHARQSVSWLLGAQTLADVAVWADQYLEGNNQTATWHYTNIPPFATSYDRDRDCPTQPGVSAGGRNDKWRDCIVDRVLYNQERLADGSLDRADRAIALKFLVHLVGDLHQPFHALGVERGGNGIQVIAFGSADCSSDGMTPRPCNLHGIWDSTLIARRKLGDLQYLTSLQQLIRTQRLDKEPIDSPAVWTMESHALAKAALVPLYGKLDDAYYEEHSRVVDKRLALGGLRLAALLNRSLTTDPSRQ